MPAVKHSQARRQGRPVSVDGKSSQRISDQLGSGFRRPSRNTLERRYGLVI